AISRTREYAADRRGAEICGQPLWLASALDKIARNARAIQNPAAERNPASAHMFIVNPLSGERMDNLFSTHPNTENRIAALNTIAQEFGGAGGRTPAAPDEPQPQAGPWGGAPVEESQPPDQPNPWGRNPTGPRSGRS